MPLYEYLCDSCHERSEVLQRFEDPPLTVCPNCGGNLRKLLSAPAFQFKGSGWYVSDYARKSEGGSSGSGTSSGAKESADTASSAGSATSDTGAKDSGGSGAGAAGGSGSGSGSAESPAKGEGAKAPAAAATSKPAKAGE